MSDNLKKRRGGNFKRSRVPTKAPVVFAAKYTLLPSPARLSSNPIRFISNSGAEVFIPTSRPTINKMLRKQYRIFCFQIPVPLFLKIVTAKLKTEK